MPPKNSLQHSHELWKKAKAAAKSAKNTALQDAVKTFKQDLGPSLEQMSKCYDEMAKWQAVAEKARMTVLQAVASYQAALTVRKAETGEGAELYILLKGIKSQMEGFAPGKY